MVRVGVELPWDMDLPKLCFDGGGEELDVILEVRTTRTATEGVRCVWRTLSTVVRESKDAAANSEASAIACGGRTALLCATHVLQQAYTAVAVGSRLSLSMPRRIERWRYGDGACA